MRKNLLIIVSLGVLLSTSSFVFAGDEEQKPLPKTLPAPSQSSPQNKADNVTKSKMAVGNFNYGQYGDYQELPDYLKNHPAVLLKNAVERVSQFVSKGGVQDVRVLDRFLDEQIAPFFDFEEMASLVGGRLYHKMDDVNQVEFQQRLQILMFDTLTSQMVSFDGSMPQAAFFPPVMNDTGQMIARVRILRRNMRPSNLAFRFVNASKGWKVVDVSSNGNSAILYYRQYYRSYVRELKMRKRMEAQQQSIENKKQEFSADKATDK